LSENLIEKPKISIGVPVFNGQNFIKARLDSILNQSFTDFEVIISDNNSTDLTLEICKEYAKKDKRIHLTKQEKNIGLFWNYKFVLDNSLGDYFVIANVDDLWEKDFLLKNFETLESNPKIVVSMGKITRYGSFDTFDEKKSDTFFTRIYKKNRKKLRSLNIFSISGNYESKASFCLRKYNFWIQFGLFRRQELQSSMMDSPFYGWDYAFVLNVLRHGDVFVHNLPLMKFYSKGASGQGVSEFLRQQKLSKQFILLPHAPLTKWCLKNIGIIFFLKNIDFFIKLNFLAIISMIIDMSKK
jgi:glycosyltransferase involved in cell wall biosynthesis